jgi:GTP cyclohydrolase IB
MKPLPDIQNEVDDRDIIIDEVGISHVRHPVTFDDDVLRQTGVADFEVTVRLSGDRRGTHLSRMVQGLQNNFQVVNPHAFPSALKAMVDLLEVETATVSFAMAIATEVRAPATGEAGWQVHDLRLRGQISPDTFALATTVSTDVTTLCPCSKAISEYGAHNQRSQVSLTVCGDGDTPYPLGVMPMVHLIRSNCSSPVFPVVKRPDERALTMTAYENPMFAEDLVRQLSLACREHGVAHSLDMRTLESIHSHDAVARLSWRPAALSGAD